MPTISHLPDSTSAATNNFTSSTGQSSSNKHLDVDDPIGSPDDSASYLFRVDVAANQRLGFPAFTVPAGSTIQKVQIFARAQRTAAGAVNIRLSLIVGGTAHLGSDQALTTSWADYVEDFTVNPATGLAWTVNDVNGTGPNPIGGASTVEYGMRSLAAGEEGQMTQTYLRVEYATAGKPHPYYAQMRRL